MKVLYFVFVVSFPCNFFCYCGHSTRKGATKKCCQTNNTFEPKKFGRGTDQFLRYHKIDELSKVVWMHFRQKTKKCCQTNNTFQPQFIFWQKMDWSPRQTSWFFIKFLRHHKMGKLSKVVGMQFQKKSETTMSHDYSITLQKIWRSKDLIIS